MRNSTVRLAILCVLLSLLSGCGSKGPLELPADEPEQPEQPAQ